MWTNSGEAANLKGKFLNGPLVNRDKVSVIYLKHLF